jgi:MFS family permease
MSSRSERAGEGVRAFRNGPYRVLYVAFGARGMQVWMQFVALPLLVLELGGSAADVGLVTGLFLIPIAAVAPIAGVVGDLVDRRRTLIVLGAYGAVHGLVMAALVVSGGMSIPLLAVFAALYGVLNAVEIPIRLAFIAEVVPKDDLANGVVMGQMAFVVTRILGPAVAGLVAAEAGLGALFALIGLAGVVVAVATWRVRVAGTPPAPAGRSPWRSLVEGLRYSAATNGVRQPLLLLGAVSIFGLSFQVVLPLYAVDQLALDRHEFGLMLAVMGIGALVATVPMAWLQPAGARRALIGSSTAVAVAVGALTITSHVPVAFAIVAIAGAASNIALSSASVALQDAVDGAVRARVLGLQAALFQGGQGIGGLLMGLATEAVGVGPAMLGGAVIVGLTTFVLVLAWPLQPVPAVRTVRPIEERPPA